jgi:predicted metal-binding membrane protein
MSFNFRGFAARYRSKAWVFLGGYLLIWAGASPVAALPLCGLGRAGLLSMAMASTSATLGGVILLAAGLTSLRPSRAPAFATARARCYSRAGTGYRALQEHYAWGSGIAATASAVAGS